MKFEVTEKYYPKVKREREDVIYTIDKPSVRSAKSHATKNAHGNYCVTYSNPWDEIAPGYRWDKDGHLTMLILRKISE